MTDKIRWGIISTARINRQLIDPIKNSARSELVGVASRNYERAKAYAAEKGIPKAYGSYEDMLADPEIDVVYNPLPNSMHAEWTIKMAQAGKHVLCEKPLVLTPAELDQVEAAAQANNVTVFEAFMYLHHPQIERIQAVIEAGEIGELRLINSWFSFYLPPENAENVRLKPTLGGGSLWDVGCYPNSLANFFAQAGAPTQVWAHQLKDSEGVDVVASAQLLFKNGVTAQIASGFRLPFRVGAQLVGDGGYLTITQPWKPYEVPNNVKLHRRGDEDNPVVIDTPHTVNAYVSEVEAMEACVIDGAAPVLPLSMSRQFLTSLLAIYESAETGQVVKLAG